MVTIWRYVLALAIVSAGSAAAAQGGPPPGCTASEHSQFDFWVGSWDVFPTGKPDQVARSLIEKLYGGCTVRENWMPLKGTGGGSLNMYDPAEGRWIQTWHDSANARVVFTGGLAGGRMVLTGFWKGAQGPGKDGLVRMTYTPGTDGSVRQLGEISTDHGLTWKPFFDLTYKPRAASN